MTTHTIDTAAAAEDDDPRVVRRSTWLAVLTRTTTLVFLVDVVLVVVFSVLSHDHVFWSQANFEALMRNGTQMLLLSGGLTLLLGAGVIDLSVGASLVLASTIGAKVVRSLADGPGGARVPGAHVGAIVAGLVIAVLAGVAMGLVNGLIITKLRVNSLIATLGTLGVAQGVAYSITGGSDVFNLPTSLQTGFALQKLGPVPLPTLLALLLLAGLWALVKYTRYGLHTLAIGSNIASAERAGINTARHIISISMTAGVFVGLAGFMDLARFGGTSQSGHGLDGLSAVTAVVIGGTGLFGGRINIFGTVWGAVLSIVLLSGLVIINVKPFYQLIATGVILVGAVYVDGVRRRITEHA